MFYSQVILAKKGPLAKVWTAAHWGDKRLSRPQIFTTDIDQSCIDIMNPTVPLALRLSGHLLLGVVRIYSRKVKYVLHDCNEAMIKLKSTFANGTGSGGTAGGQGSNANNELLTDRDAATHHLITNFGEYDQVHVVEGFVVPMPEENEWVLADDQSDDDDDDSQNNRRLSHHRRNLAGHSPTLTAPEEETWAPFDPENEDDEDEEGFALPARSRVSDIEIARAAGDDSMLSDAADKTRRSSILDKSDLTGPDGNSVNANAQNEEDDDFGMALPFDDDESDQGGQPASGAVDDPALQLSDGEDVGLAGSGKNDISGLEDDSTGTPGSKRTAGDASVEKRKKRKRRKVVIEKHQSELSDSHIREMLKNTSDIMRPQVDPAAVWEGDGRSDGLFSPKARAPPALTRPFVEDGGYDDGANLHPRLKKLWHQNFFLALGESSPFEFKEDADDIEETRHARAAEDEDDDEQTSIQSDLAAKTSVDAEGEMKADDEEEEDDFGAMPLPDDDFEDQEPDEGGPVDFDEFDEEQERSQSGEDDLELGLVNELQLEEEEEDEEGRQALGEVSSSTNKWHQHTVKVLKHLQAHMRDPDAVDEDKEDGESEENLPDHLQFHDMTKNITSRRNAASVFFEILQLKTWDFIDVGQEDEYGDIKIAPGVRFSEAPPSK